MNMLFQDELTTKFIFCRIDKEIKEEQLKKAINFIDYHNKKRAEVLEKCNSANKTNPKNI